MWVKPFQQLIRQSEAVAQNFGAAANPFAVAAQPQAGPQRQRQSMVVELKQGALSSVSEASELQDRFRAFFQQMSDDSKQSKQQDKQGLINNAYFGWEADGALPGSVPSAPPPAYDESERKSPHSNGVASAAVSTSASASRPGVVAPSQVELSPLHVQAPLTTGPDPSAGSVKWHS